MMNQQQQQPVQPMSNMGMGQPGMFIQQPQQFSGFPQQQQQPFKQIGPNLLQGQQPQQPQQILNSQMIQQKIFAQVPKQMGTQPQPQLQGPSPQLQGPQSQLQGLSAQQLNKSAINNYQLAASNPFQPNLNQKNQIHPSNQIEPLSPIQEGEDVSYQNQLQQHYQKQLPPQPSQQSNQSSQMQSQQAHQQSQQQSNFDPSFGRQNFKTVPCRFYHGPSGCQYGEKCSFIHDSNHVGKPTPNMFKYVRPMHALSKRSDQNLLNFINYKQGEEEPQTHVWLSNQPNSNMVADQPQYPNINKLQNQPQYPNQQGQYQQPQQIQSHQIQNQQSFQHQQLQQQQNQQQMQQQQLQMQHQHQHQQQQQTYQSQQSQISYLQSQQHQTSSSGSSHQNKQTINFQPNQFGHNNHKGQQHFPINSNVKMNLNIQKGVPQNLPGGPPQIKFNVPWQNFQPKLPQSKDQQSDNEKKN